MAPDLVQALVKAIEIKDLSTAAHTWRVVLYARTLCEEFGVDRETIARITPAAALHDLGKIDIPPEILQKPGRLTDEEFAVIKTHTAIGHERLLRMGEDDEIMLNLVRFHHERWDGLGYPDGLCAEDIPEGARYFGVIDTFDALTSVRPYRQEVGIEAAHKAIEEIQRCSGERYCPEAAEAFANLFRTGKLDWILDYFNDKQQLPDFSPELPTDGIEKQSKRLG